MHTLLDGLILLLAGFPSPLDLKTTPPVEVRIESTMGTLERQIRQFAFDGNPETAYVSATNPSAADHLTLVLDRPVASESVEVLTGRADGTDRLLDGSLEISADGVKFEVVSRFADGLARADLKNLRIQAIRIKPAVELAHPLVIREIRLQTEEPVKPFAWPVEFTTDASDAPEMKPWADRAALLCERWYPRINEELASDGYRPPTQISITLKSSYKGVAEASGTRITGSVKFFQDHPDDLGAMIHETCHVVQRYRGRGNPSWLVEGVADHFRFFVFEPGKAGPVNPRRSHYNNSYRTTASFLAFVSGKYDPTLVRKLNQRMREGTYRDEAFRELTGKTVQELDAEWLASLTPKPAPVPAP